MDDDLEKNLKDIKSIYRTTFDSPEGQKVLADLTSAYYHRGSYTKNDSYETSYREGQRSVIIRIINLIKENKNG